MKVINRYQTALAYFHQLEVLKAKTRQPLPDREELYPELKTTRPKHDSNRVEPVDSTGVGYHLDITV
ncbi:MAG: hypothetical protein ACOCU8_01070 [Patescibacteria group bacterium]